MAVFDPDDLKILRNIEANNSLTVIPYVSTRKEIKAAIYRHYFKANTIEPVRRTILIVNDDHFVLEQLHEMLGKCYKVFSAKDGMKAYREAVTKKPHVILTDKEMPKLCGFGLLNAIQSMPETKEFLLFYSLPPQTLTWNQKPFIMDFSTSYKSQ
jgi:CheY-like chemotaxis protein